MTGYRYSRGFTLIELLVVIAIIGILSAVVLASLSTARSKGQDASVQSNLDTVRTQAEVYRNGDGNDTYGIDATDCVSGCLLQMRTSQELSQALIRRTGPMV